ncbi:delta-like protein 4 [Ruditapes philippinarum]|uniref:delta-like protein 4 n=1 Tax=Ruditapes philippinarum TaxID=129788 RepID=UPI00295B0BF8|nr:delta-like protein 4 [Ruditapes philippinarum]XP_060568819.1 delta-like protein 4 [Ruditapes philippinarum]XP_060568820.1 delta-like protein 4 [Ruditapes philippinarum]XP_060568821.1 delta-like protein 4 [Ruditapes philippinarum]
MSCRLNLTVLLIIVFYGDACCSTCFFGICSWAEWKTVSTNCGSSYCSQQRARQICCLDIGWSAQTCSRYCPASGGGGYSQSGNGDSSTLTCNHCSNGGSLQYYGRACDCVPGYYGTCCQYEIYECSSSPCKNGGTCIDKVNGFSCTCPPRLYGTYCETGKW